MPAADEIRVISFNEQADKIISQRGATPFETGNDYHLWGAATCRACCLCWGRVILIVIVILLRLHGKRLIKQETLRRPAIGDSCCSSANNHNYRSQNPRGMHLALLSL